MRTYTALFCDLFCQLSCSPVICYYQTCSIWSIILPYKVLRIIQFFIKKTMPGKNVFRLENFWLHGFRNKQKNSYKHYKNCQLIEENVLSAVDYGPVASLDHTCSKTTKARKLLWMVNVQSGRVGFDWHVVSKRHITRNNGPISRLLPVNWNLFEKYRLIYW